MSRRTSGLAEVTRAAHDPCTKMLLPDPVDYYPCSERMSRLRQPTRKRYPASASVTLKPRFLDAIGFQAFGQHRWRPRLDQWSWIIHIAAQQDARRSRLAAHIEEGAKAGRFFSFLR